MAANLLTIPESNLGFVELNPDRSTTIVFIHGAFSSPREPTLVIPYLQNYHILIPAMHTNVKNLHPKPTFTLASASANLAALIEHRAKNARAHVYGHSMGGHIAVNLAMEYSDRVASLMASGITLFSHWRWWVRAALTPYGYAECVLLRVVLPTSLQVKVFNAMVKPGSASIVEEWMGDPVEGNWAACKEVSAALGESLPPGKPVDVRCPALIIAGLASVPAADPSEDVRWVVGEIGKAGGWAKGIGVRDGGHPWIIQLPELCSKVIAAWIEGRELPDGVVDIA